MDDKARWRRKNTYSGLLRSPLYAGRFGDVAALGLFKMSKRDSDGWTADTAAEFER